MLIRTKVKVTTRFPDGRPWSAGEGVTSVIDDVDTMAVAHMRRLAKLGQLEILDEEGAEAHAEAHAEAKQARTPDAELDQLREQAAAAGITVDRRWGAVRLRDEIAAAVSPPGLEQDPEVAG